MSSGEGLLLLLLLLLMRLLPASRAAAATSVIINRGANSAAFLPQHGRSSATLLLRCRLSASPSVTRRTASERLTNCPQSWIEVRPTALQFLQTPTFTLTFNL